MSIHKGEQYRKRSDPDKGQKTLRSCQRLNGILDVSRKARRAASELFEDESSGVDNIRPPGAHCGIHVSRLHLPPSTPSSLTVNDPLDSPDAQRDDEADGIPGAAGAVGHCGGHHGGQREDDDGAVEHLSSPGGTGVTSELWH